MKIEAKAIYELDKKQAYTGRIMVTMNWLPENDAEHIFLKEVLAAGVHEDAEIVSAHAGDHFTSVMTISDPVAFEKGKVELGLYNEWKRNAEMSPLTLKPVSFEMWKEHRLKMMEPEATKQ